MATKRLLSTAAKRKQHLLVEFSGLKTACPQGVFMSLTPGDPTLWAGILFIRKGPYTPAILRFQISFPPTYPSLPPLVTFSTDIFHPLITPLTTYMYTTDIQDSGTVSATDDERLPPGGFSLRHGFPNWFGRASRTGASGSRQVSTSATHLQTPVKSMSPGGSTTGPETPSTGVTTPPRVQGGKQESVSTYEVLRYIRSTFDDAEVLDSVSLEAAGNPGAWHAWRTHRAPILETELKSPITKNGESTPWHKGLSDEEGKEGKAKRVLVPSTPIQARKPGEWNWEGVWEVRSRKGIEGSVAEPVLYGNTAMGDDLIRFLQLEDAELEAVKDRMMKSLETL